MDLLAAFFIPSALIIIGAFAKKLVRGNGLRASDFFLGVELSLAALSSSLIFLTSIIGANANSFALEKAPELSLFMLTNFFLIFVIMSLHQDWEHKPQNPLGQKVILCGVCNIIGAVLLGTYVIVFGRSFQ